MEKKDMNQTNRATTGIDADGNLQIRSSGVNPPRTPAPRGSSPAPGRNAPRRAVRTKGEPKRKPQGAPVPKRDEGVEYSFANSALFNNGVKNEKTDATAASEARKARAGQMGAAPNTDTRVMNQPRRRPVRPQNNTTVAPALRQKDAASARPVVSRPVQSRSPQAETQTKQGMPAVQNPPNRPSAAKTDSFATKVTSAVKKPEKKKKIKATSAADLAADGIERVSGAIAAMNSVTRALLYIAAVMLVSVIFSAVIITNCNDIFAFVKSEEQYSITIETGTDLNKLANQLKELGVIEHKNTFKLYIKYRNKDSDAYTPGTYTVSPSMSYDQLISAITPKVERETVTITIPEGYTVDEIIDLFVSKGIGTKEGFVDVINNGDFSDYWFVNEIPANPDRYYRLEGYLFPDTYYFYTNMSEYTIIGKFLDNFDRKFEEEYKVHVQAKNMTVDELVTLASIVQAEGKQRTITLEDGDGETRTTIDYGLISSVFHNRLNLRNPMKLQSDATTLFAMEMEGISEEELSNYTKETYTNPYNTYNIHGLPPGAICNPGMNAIAFALTPDSSPYYYFVSDDKGNTYFAETLNEHNENLANIQ